MKKLAGLIVAGLLAGTSMVVAQTGLPAPGAPSSSSPVSPPTFPMWNAPEPTPATAPQVPKTESVTQPPVLAPVPDQSPSSAVIHSEPAPPIVHTPSYELPSSTHSSAYVVESAPPVTGSSSCACQQNQSGGQIFDSSPVFGGALSSAPAFPMATGYGYSGYGSAPTYETPVPPLTDGQHGRYPYYSYRRPWYTPGAVSQNVTIPW